MNPSLLIGLALAVGAPAKDPPKKATSVVGVWTIEKAVVGGREEAPSPPGTTWEFTADGKFVMRLKGRGPREGSYTADLKRDPAEIDITPPGRDPKPGLGIVKVAGDTLTLCYVGGAERPARFESPERTQVILITLKRQKND